MTPLLSWLLQSFLWNCRLPLFIWWHIPFKFPLSSPFLQQIICQNFWKILLSFSMWESYRLPCWPPRGRQVSHQRWISGNIYHVCLHQVWIRLPTLALKPRGDVTRPPKQECQWLHKKDLCPPKIFFFKYCCLLRIRWVIELAGLGIDFGQDLLALL